jgi:hypothetical protein
MEEKSRKQNVAPCLSRWRGFSGHVCGTAAHAHSGASPSRISAYLYENVHGPVMREYGPVFAAGAEHDVTSQKTVIFTVIGVRISDPK